MERFGSLEVVGRRDAFDSALRGTAWRSQAMRCKFFARSCKEQKQLPRRRFYEELRRYKIWELSVPSTLSGNMEVIVTLMGGRVFPAGQEVWWKAGQEDHLGPAGSDVHVTRNCRPSVRVMVTRNSNRSVSLNRVLLERILWEPQSCLFTYGDLWRFSREQQGHILRQRPYSPQSVSY